jgi:AcrR family transcriptional regulator
MATREARRERYHHGNLRAALVEVAVALARDGGPEAVVLREAARRVGVSAPAAYRHFADRHALVRAVRQYAHGALDTELRATAGDIHHLALAYVRFALTEPGLFRTAFARDGSPVRELGHLPAYAALAGALDDLGLVSPGPQSGLACWALVHGLATLMLDGPLGALDAAERDAVVARAVDGLLTGLGA